MSQEHFRLALVGCGRISQVHFDALQRVEGLDLCAVADVEPDRAASAGARYGVPWFTSLDQVLKDSDCDVVTITTPSGLHPQHGIKAARSGRHVIVEKPMGVRVADADQLIDECDRAKVRLFVVKQNRLNATVQLLKRAIDKGRFGRIFMANSTVRWQRPQEYYDAASWRGTWELDGGAFMNQASHYVDLIRWLLGPVDTVMAHTATLARRIEAEDSGAAVIRFESGAIGVIEVTMLTYPKNLEGSFTIMGERGTVRIGGTSLNKIEHWAFAEYDDDDRRVEGANTEPPNVYGFGHERFYRNVLATLRGEEPAETDGRSGRHSLELIEAIYESSRTRRLVSLQSGAHALLGASSTGAVLPRTSRELDAVSG
jgi:UDP-N-acetyl-2-amino-2-deoxyglucuronate dehydrogenase